MNKIIQSDSGEPVEAWENPTRITDPRKYRRRCYIRRRSKRHKAVFTVQAALVCMLILAYWLMSLAFVARWL